LEPGEKWRITSRLESSAGWLHGGAQDAFVGSLGIGFLAGREGFPLKLDIGSSPTCSVATQFGESATGCRFNLQTHAGVIWEIGERWSLGYRFQHMSNAHLATPNPGLKPAHVLFRLKVLSRNLE